MMARFKVLVAAMVAMTRLLRPRSLTWGLLVTAVALLAALVPESESHVYAALPLRITFDSADQRDPAWSADGQTIAFVSREGKTSGARNIWTIEPDGANLQQVAQGPDQDIGIGWSVAWVGNTGDLITNERVSFHEYMRFDLSQVGSPPVVRTTKDGGSAFFTRLLIIPGGLGGDWIAISPDGTTVAWAIRTTLSNTWEIRHAPLASLSGQQATTAGTSIFQTTNGRVRGLDFSPDGSRLVFSATEADWDQGVREDLFVYDFGAGSYTQITSTGANGERSTDPSWGSNERIAYAFLEGGDWNIYAVDPNGANAEQVTADAAADVDPDWSPDGSQLVFASNRDGGDQDLYVFDLAPPPPPDHKVLFINGINSQSSCAAGGFAGEVEWMTKLLGGETAGYEWANDLVGIDSQDDFLYYDYTSDGDTTPQFCGKDGRQPDYQKRDTCWSLNDYYDNMFLDTFGQTRRLANHIDTILSGPGVTLTLVGFSQGGILAAAAVDSYIGEPNLSRIRSVVTFDSPLQGIPDLAEWAYQGLIAGCSAHKFDSPWDMEDDSEYIRAIVNEPDPNVPLFSVNRVGIVVDTPVPDQSSRVPRWEGEEGHVEINTALAQGSHTWGEATTGFLLRSAEDELREMRLFLVCAVSPFSICETMSKLEPGGFAQIDRATSVAAQPATSSVGATTQGFAVPADTSVLTTLVLGDPSYSVALVTPSATVIDETTVDPTVVVQVLAGAWLFKVASPEVGQWQVKSNAPDLSSLAILSATTPSSTADQDADGTRDIADNCTGLYNPGQTDTDGDGLGDACDPDDDGDGVMDIDDNCPDLPNAAQTDTDGNGRGDACDLGGYQDWDSDGVVDNDDNCPIDSNGSQLNTDADILGNACDANDDDDACTDDQELGPDETLGGRRDPLNPWDFYDVLGPGAALPIDGVIDLPNDILGVIQHFSPQGQAPYDAQFDRGPSSGPNPWNMTAPDGVIDLPNDILGVILQHNHRCV